MSPLTERLIECIKPLNQVQINHILKDLKLSSRVVDELHNTQHIIPARNIINFIISCFTREDNTGSLIQAYTLLGYMIKHKIVTHDDTGLAITYKWLDNKNNDIDVLYDIYDCIYSEYKYWKKKDAYYTLNVLLKFVIKSPLPRTECYTHTTINEYMIKDLLMKINGN